MGLGPVPEPVWDPETRIRLRSPEAYTVFFAYLAALFVAGIPQVLMGDDTDYQLVYLAFNSLCVGVATLWIAFRNWETIRPSLAPSGLGSAWFFAGLCALPLLLALNFGYHEMMEAFLGLPRKEDELLGLAVGNHVAVFLLICLLPAVTEEIGYRSFTYTVLLRSLSPLPAACMTSALFATLHLSFWSWPYLFGLGLFLNYVSVRSRSVLPAMVLHMAHNAAVIFVFPSLERLWRG